MSNPVMKSCIDNLTAVVIDELEDILDGIVREQKPNGKRKRVWVRNWIARRSYLGASSTLLQEIRAEDIPAYRNHLRMGVDKFDELLLKVSNDIQRQDSHMRMAIPARTKLEVTLRFLATGDSYGSLEFLYRIPRSTLCEFIPDVCKAIGDALKSYIQVPSTTAEWGRIEEGFRTKWNLSRARRIVENAFGILVSRFRIFAKHIAQQPPTVDVIVLAACSIHNWLRKTSKNYITSACVDSEDIMTGDLTLGGWRSELNKELKSVSFRGGNNYTRQAEAIRRYYLDYFNGNGSVTWQNKITM